MKTSWNYSELPEGIYSADVSPFGERFMFRACPNRGDHCIEGIFKTEEQASKVGVRFAAGEKGIAGLYSAAY